MTRFWWQDDSDGGDDRLCRVSVDALAEAMRLRRLERDGAPCWSTVEARELVAEAMRCELEQMASPVGWAQSIYRQMAKRDADEQCRGRCQAGAKRHSAAS